MSEENGGKDPMPAPPSFIPSAGRKKTESQPHKSTIPSQSGSPSIPSFSPAAQPARSSAPHAGRRTAQPSSVTPSGSSAPQSFRPAANSTSRPRKSASSSPASFAPASAPNNHRASQQVRGSSSIPTGMPRTTRQNTPRQPLSGNSTTGFQSTAKAVLPTESDIWGGSFSRFPCCDSRLGTVDILRMELGGWTAQQTVLVDEQSRYRWRKLADPRFRRTRRHRW